MALVAILTASQATPAPATASELKVPDAQQFVGAPQGQPLTGDVLHDRTQQVGGLLRCPVCQGMSVSDSPSEMAVNMKGQVRELLMRGYTEEQILRYFELSYGQFVLLRPKTPVVWLLPVAALVAGTAVVFFKIRKLQQKPAGPVVQSAAPADDAYLARVRDLVGGDKP
jgi:cytochrome c-type biogenesis protein CcmH